MTKRSFTIAAIVAAATIGTGVFAMPYVIQTSGWFLTLGYFVALIAVVSLAHVLYLRTLVAVREKERLLGLARKYFGGTGFWIGFLAIVIGLMLSFVAYLVLGVQFMTLLFPWLSPAVARGVFWFLLACLIWGSEGRVAWLEVAGIALITCVVLFIFGTGHPAVAFVGMPFAVAKNFFLPFGAVVFALAGWTSVEQVYELTQSGEGDGGRFNAGMFGAFVIGTALAGLLYWLFALGVIGTAPHVAMDTISGIAGWPVWRKDTLAILGLLAIAVVSLPLSREIRGALEKDLRWNSIASRATIIILPIVTVLAGFNNFLVVVSVAGGVFLSAQYLLIIAVGRRTLDLSSREKALLDTLSIIFVCAAIYSLYLFIVK